MRGNFTKPHSCLLVLTGLLTRQLKPRSCMKKSKFQSYIHDDKLHVRNNRRYIPGLWYRYISKLNVKTTNFKGMIVVMYQIKYFGYYMYKHLFLHGLASLNACSSKLQCYMHMQSITIHTRSHACMFQLKLHNHKLHGIGIRRDGKHLFDTTEFSDSAWVSLNAFRMVSNPES